MSRTRACSQCLRHAHLLAKLAPYIERCTIGGAASGSIRLFELTDQELAEKVAPNVADVILTRIEALGESALRDELVSADCWATCRHDELYPAALRVGDAAPWALFGRGDPGLLDGVQPHDAVAIVGARRATSYGREVARQLGHDLARAGIVVVSGLAFGIDGCAHRGALDGGRTIAVLGCGPDICYPASHRSLWRRISENGLVLSELPPGAAPWRWTFPARNRIIAALAAMTVVVEAAARSGSLLTAVIAAELGRDVGAVPGPVNSRASAGPNDLLAGGACLVRDAQDVLDSLLGPGGRRIEEAAIEAAPEGDEPPPAA